MTCVQSETTDDPASCIDDCGPTTESFFDNSKVATLRITVDEDYMRQANYEPEQWLDLLWDNWNNHCGPYEWTPVRMEYESSGGIGNYVLEQVGMRLRGGRSRGVNQLAGFKLDYDKVSPLKGRRFADLNKLEALSNEGDDSNMLQCISYQLMRDFGIEAPRCNHIRVYINGTLYGLMENVERAKDGRFLLHHFGTNDGHLYAASTSCEYSDYLADLEYHGSDFSGSGQYSGVYEILRGTQADAEQYLIPMLKCGDPNQTPSDDDFKACISDWLDVEQWLRLIAAESLAPTLEDFVGGRRNFYLYFKPDAGAPRGGRFNVWGWDHDTGLHKGTCYPRDCNPFEAVAAWYGPQGARAKLVLRLTQVFRKKYCALARSFLADVYDPEKVTQMAAVIEPFMEDDPVIRAEDWRAEVESMRSFMVQHRNKASAAIEAACD
jgi:spore coat protein CotH